MPNWCTCNCIVTGDRAELESLVKILNTMENLKNGFGRYWAGNLVNALGVDCETVRGCRGVFDPDFSACSCFFGPVTDEQQEFEVSSDDRIYLSTTSAWGPMYDVMDLICTKFPTIEFSYSATDEFGNFHETHNPYDFEELDYYYSSWGSFRQKDLPELVANLEELGEEFKIPEGESLEYIFSKEYQALIDKYNAEHSEEDDFFVIEVGTYEDA